jgi:hypothetical protein
MVTASRSIEGPKIRNAIVNTRGPMLKAALEEGKQ